MTVSRKTKTKPLSENKKRLVELSQLAKAMRERAVAEATNEFDAVKFASMNINDFLIIIHTGNNTVAEQWKTFNQWKEEGLSVKKGEKANYVWGAPRKANKKGSEQEKKKSEISQSDLEAKYQFWPMCALFSNLQVERKEPPPLLH